MSFGFAWYLLSFRGRICRQEFWLGFVGAIVVLLLLRRPLEDIGVSYFRPIGRPWYRDELDLALALPKLVTVGLLTWPVAAIFVKRLHDLNVSGWWLMILPALSAATEVTSLDRWHVLSWVGVIIIGLMPGTPGDNRFDRSASA
jgi:uncharacterized membrane protein YhaH (DUF805 family)